MAIEDRGRVVAVVQADFAVPSALAAEVRAAIAAAREATATVRVEPVVDRVEAAAEASAAAAAPEDSVAHGATVRGAMARAAAALRAAVPDRAGMAIAVASRRAHHEPRVM